MGGSLQEREIKVLYSKAQIRKRVKALALEIADDYQSLVKEREEVWKDFRLVLVGILNGCEPFLSHLARNLGRIFGFGHITITYMKISSYGDDVDPGELQTKLDIDIDCEGADLLIVEDIIDTARTMKWVQDSLRNRSPRSLRTCVLIDKVVRREMVVDLDYVGFKLEEDEFLVGYGLDGAGLYRECPYIGVFCD